MIVPDFIESKPLAHELKACAITMLPTALGLLDKAGSEPNGSCFEREEKIH